MELAIVFTILWVLWGVAFIAIEAGALIRKKRGDTLTDHVLWLKRWRFRGFKVGFVALLVFWIWLTIHFFLEWF